MRESSASTAPSRVRLVRGSISTTRRNVGPRYLQVCAEQPERLVVDLREVDFVDSTALGVLIEVRTKLENRQSFLLASPGLETHRALTISGLDQHLSVHDTVESALAASVSS